MFKQLISHDIINLNVFSFIEFGTGEIVFVLNYLKLCTYEKMKVYIKSQTNLRQILLKTTRRGTLHWFQTTCLLLRPGRSLCSTYKSLEIQCFTLQICWTRPKRQRALRSLHWIHSAPHCSHFQQTFTSKCKWVDPLRLELPHLYSVEGHLKKRVHTLQKNSDMWQMTYDIWHTIWKVWVSQSVS